MCDLNKQTLIFMLQCNQRIIVPIFTKWNTFLKVRKVRYIISILDVSNMILK